MAPVRLSEDERRASRAAQSRAYNTRTREERNAKKRIRMAHLRALDSMRSPEELAVRLAARRAADGKYRSRNRRNLALKARFARADAAEVRAEEAAQARLKRERQEILDDIEARRRERMAWQQVRDVLAEPDEPECVVVASVSPQVVHNTE
ncbi:hypothetical protein B0H15DRAFT_957015 [Mycena belliarum]|uniref:Uncharacterized protein n=1 Tax=Mycena belliarum TaxID=1033014 RepID=A0AAD6TQ26_9AGAR|nr:hypothetical protein B0H15DRAFT_957015 [Mycena belliae]